MFYNKLIDKNPYSAPYWFGLARCYFEQQLFDKAIEACDYAIVSDEEFADAYMMKGHAFYQLGNEESALENYTLAENIKPSAPISSICSSDSMKYPKDTGKKGTGILNWSYTVKIPTQRCCRLYMRM